MRRIGATATNHGWRSIARDALAEELDVDFETAEFVLGHVKQGVEGAYRRGTSFQRRRVAMQKYADWLCGREVEATVTLRVAAASGPKGLTGTI
jgi:hypothetical protein